MQRGENRKNSKPEIVGVRAGEEEEEKKIKEGLIITQLKQEQSRKQPSDQG